MRPGSAAARGAPDERGAGRRPATPGDRAGARRPRAAPGRRDHGAVRRRRGDRGTPAGVRRHHAADPGAEGGRVARGRAPPRARDQESADADPAVRRAAGPPLPVLAARPPGSWSRSAPRRSSARWNRSRGWWTSSRSSPGCRRPRRIPTHLPLLAGRHPGPVRRPVPGGEDRDAWRRRRCRWCGSTPSRSGAS